LYDIKSSKDRKGDLGGEEYLGALSQSPLPDQLPNTMQAHQTTLLSLLQDLARTVRQIPTHYVPVLQKEKELHGK
jgi:hypothetical protein